MNIQVSIIIPVYNAQEYLHNCIDSILGQTYDNFEVICVDDGSTDWSAQILEEYTQKDSRIKIISQSNCFAGAARNRGLEEAKGRYVLFFDADDFCHRDMLKILVEEAEKNRTEILVFDVFRYSNREGKIQETSWKALDRELFGEGIKSAAEIAKYIFNFTVPAPWNKLYLREFINGNELKFQEIRRANDLYFVYASFTYAKRIGILNRKLYYYRVHNPKSLQGTIKFTPSVFAEALLKLKRNLERRGHYELYKKSFFNMTVSVCTYNLIKQQGTDVYKELIRTLKYDIFPELGFQNERLWNTKKVGTIKTVIDRQENILIYGAGAMAELLVNAWKLNGYLSKDRIKIVVTSRSGNPSEIQEIKVYEIEEIKDEELDSKVIIAISGAVQEQIYNMLRTRGYRHIIKVEFNEIMAFLIE